MALKSTAGIILPKTKNTSKEDILSFDCPSSVRIGLPSGCAPVVKEGDVVSRYQRIACDENGFGVFASVPGVITSCGETFVSIENDMSRNECEPDAEKPQTMDDINFDTLVEYCKRYGIRGAYSGVPLYKKIVSAHENCARIIINCIESDPYSGHVRALVKVSAKEIVLGAKILMFGMGVKKCVFAIGSTYSAAGNALKEAIDKTPGMIIASVKERYPIGNEYILLNAIYRKELSRADSVESLGYPVISAETVYELFNSLRSGLPSVYKLFTVAGNGFSKMSNYRVPNGCVIADLADLIGTNPKFTPSFVLGGPMNAVAVDRTEYIKNDTNMLYAFKFKKNSPVACIRCARCAQFCPMDLVPFLFHENYRAESPEDSVKRGLYNCIECGICSYMCVGKLDLVAEIRAQKEALESLKLQSADLEANAPTETDISDICEDAVSKENEIDHNSCVEEIIDAVAVDIVSDIVTDETEEETPHEDTVDVTEETPEESHEETQDVSVSAKEEGYPSASETVESESAENNMNDGEVNCE